MNKKEAKKRGKRMENFIFLIIHLLLLFEKIDDEDQYSWHDE
jgi:hypothetical protein